MKNKNSKKLVLPNTLELNKAIRKDMPPQSRIIESKKDKIRKNKRIWKKEIDRE